jgi:hypothetical protein
MGSELVKTVQVDGIKVDIYGCWDDETKDGKFDFYDMYVKGECINVGNPCYKKPTRTDVRAFLKLEDV